MSLFRQEALDRQGRRAFGAVRLYQPVAHWVLTASLVIMTGACLVFAGTMRYPRKETVLGRIIPGAGLADIVAPGGGGTIASLAVAAGSPVQPGQSIGSLSADRYGVAGSLTDQQKEGTRSRLEEIQAQERDREEAGRIEGDRLRAKTREGAAGLVRLAGAEELELKQLALSRKQLTNIDPLVKQGFISGIERDRREQVVLDHERALLELRGQIASQRAMLEDLRLQARQALISSSTERSQLRSSGVALKQSLAETDAQGTIVLRAPIAGKVASLNGRVGEFIPGGAVLATISPPGPLLAELLVPSRASGRLAQGERVGLMVDAFPFQRFGALSGTIAEIGRAPVPSVAGGSPPGDMDARYRVLVKIDPMSMQSFEARGVLRPGMALKADIVLDRQTLLDLVLDPIRSAKSSLKE